MKKNSFYKKMIMSVAGAALVSVGLNQSPNNAFNSGVTEVSAAKKTKKVKTVGANSAVYQKKGKKMVKTKKTIKVGKKVHVYAKKTVKGKTYYKIGKNQYIKAANVDGKTRKAGKKTVLYTRSGKVIKNSKVRKGQKIKVYGGVVTIKGKKYYSTKYGYIKVSALTKKAPVVKPNNDTSDNTSTPTTTKPVENNSNGSNGSTTGSNSNGSNSANSSASNSSSSGSISVPTGNDSSSNNTGSNGSSSNGGSSNGSGSTGSSSNNTNSNSSDNNSSNSSGSNSSDNNNSNDSGSNGSDNNSSDSSGSNSSDNNSSNSSETNYAENTIVIPKDYTWEKVSKADKEPIDENLRALDRASSEGMKTNRFKSESKNDDEEIIDLNKLTKDQNIKLTNFFIKLLNSARTQLGLKEIYADPKNQKLANDIAAIYLRDRKFGLVTDTEPTGHYVKGISEAAKKNGLNIEDNYIEDLSMNLQTAGPSDIYKEKTSITQAKQFIYDGIVGMLFGGTTGNDGTIMEGTEYHHARSLLYPTNITGAVSFHYGVPEDGIGAGYGEVVTHFILIPDFAIQVSDSNKGTYKPTSQN
ncbi:MAG: SEC10/PgrA surface exclusion domain-containing protein [Lactobacillus sp.]|nr:SEC10/PgrA surface exclusion domain-containing protein [Lactobacillus sp.]